MESLLSQSSPDARVNITLELQTNGQRQEKELPLKLLVLGDFIADGPSGDLNLRRKYNLNQFEFDSLMQDLSPCLDLVLNKQPVYLKFNSLSDFSPDNLIMQVPSLKKLLAMRNLLRELKANLMINTGLKERLISEVSDAK